MINVPDPVTVILDLAAPGHDQPAVRRVPCRRAAAGSCRARARSSSVCRATSRCRATSTATGRRTSRSIGRGPASGSCRDSRRGSGEARRHSGARRLQRRRHHRPRRLPPERTVRPVVHLRRPRAPRCGVRAAMCPCPATTTATVSRISRSSVRRRARGEFLRSSTGQTVVGALGAAGDIPVVADFDADRKIDFAVFRPSTGFWYITLSAGGTYSRQFGLPGDIPVPLDVTGDGRAELRVWRPATGTWFSFNRWLVPDLQPGVRAAGRRARHGAADAARLATGRSRRRSPGRRHDLPSVDR